MVAQTVKFELGGVWQQALLELRPTLPGPGSPSWRQAVETLAARAMAVPGGHLCLRILRPPGAPLRSWIGLTVPEAGTLDPWLNAARELHLGAGPSPAGGANGVSPEAPDYITALPILDYRMGGLSYLCDYRAFPLLESIAVDANAGGFGWCYQINATVAALGTEELRASRKNLVRLESQPGVPFRLLDQQRRILETAERCTWRCSEMLGAPDRASFASLGSRISDDFDGIYGRAGFSGLAWPDQSPPDAVDAWEAGLHPVAFAPCRPEIAPAELVSTDTLRSVWASQLGLEEGVSAVPRRPGGSAPVIFLSYSSPDRAAALAVCEAFEGAGLPCWIAPRDINPGREWAEAIVQGINATRITLVLMSPTANLSKHVLREVERTVNAGHPIVPVRMTDFRLNDSLGYFLSTQHWFDAFVPPFESHLRVLVEKIRRILE